MVKFYPIMKAKLHTAVTRAKNNPVLRKTAQQMKPKKTIWGFLGVVLFFIVPDIIAFIWGADITAYAHTQMLQAPSHMMATWYEALIMLFEDGGSWVNLAIGFALLIWLFF